MAPKYPDPDAIAKYKAQRSDANPDNHFCCSQCGEWHDKDTYMTTTTDGCWHIYICPTTHLSLAATFIGEWSPRTTGQRP